MPPAAPMPRRTARASSRSGEQTSSRFIAFLRSSRTRQVAAERADRENQPVQVVVDVKVAGEPGAGVLRLVPTAVRALAGGQPADAALDAARSCCHVSGRASSGRPVPRRRVFSGIVPGCPGCPGGGGPVRGCRVPRGRVAWRRRLPGRQQREQRPRGLRCGGLAPAGPAGIVVGAYVLAPATVWILVLPEPADVTPDRRLAGDRKSTRLNSSHVK